MQRQSEGDQKAPGDASPGNCERTRSGGTTGTRPRPVALLAAVVAGCCILASCSRDPVSADARKRLSAITQGLDRDVASHFLCIHEGPFPHDTGRRGLPCRRCEDLAGAGFLERTPAPESTAERPRWIYNLTPQADGIYIDTEDPVSGNRAPRFCFGRAKVHHLAAAQSAIHVGGNTAIGVEYVLEAVDAHPSLFTPAAASLGLPKPVGDNPKLFAPQRTTVMFSIDGRYIESDPSFRYGSWINR